MRTGEALKRARRERDAGRMLNAKLLYASAVFLSQSGPALILGVHQQAIEDMGNLPEVPPFEGPPPWQAHYGDRTFTISAIGVFYQDGKWLIGLAHNSTASDDRTAEADNRALISAFEAAHPEYAKAFDGVRAEARMLGDRSHTTIGLVRR